MLPTRQLYLFALGVQYKYYFFNIFHLYSTLLDFDYFEMRFEIYLLYIVAYIHLQLLGGIG